MAASGKHAKNPRQVQVGKHGVATRRNVGILYVFLAIVLVVVVCLVPLTMTQRHTGIKIDSGTAFADSARSAFTGLSDAVVQAGESGDNLPVKRADYTSHVSAKLQNSLMSGGCEIVSLGIALESMGIDADLNRIVSDFLNVDGHFATGYSGSPYSKGAGYPPGIAEAANKYLASLGESARAHNLTGSSLNTLKGIVREGYPVLIWTTMDFKDPQFAAAFDNGIEWYSNEHCVVLYGFDGDKALVSDPLEGLVERDLNRFADIYTQCGSMALAIF